MGKRRWLGTIILEYVQYVQSFGSHSKKIKVIFDGYNSSTKDHAHRRRKKLFCHDMLIRKDNIPYTSKDKFLSNENNKTELIKFISEELKSVIYCKNRGQRCVGRNSRGSGRRWWHDKMIMIVHHITPGHFPVILTTSKGRYLISDIQEKLTAEEKRYLMFAHAFTGCDTVSSVFGFSKEKLF